MEHHDLIVKRIAYLRAEIEALTRFVELELGPVEAALPAAAPVVAAPVAEEAAPAAEVRPVVAAPPARKVRWRYVPGSWYRIVGDNPFRNGNNYNLFEYLRNRYGDQPFSREELSDAIGTLARSGKLSTEQDEETFVVVFLRFAGALRGRITMSDTSRSGAASLRASADEALPLDPGEVRYRLSGAPTFRGDSINARLWREFDGRSVSRDDLSGWIERAIAEGSFETTRPAPVVARDFLARVIDQGLAERT